MKPLLDGTLPVEHFLTPAHEVFESLSNCIRQIDLVCADQTTGWQLAVKSALFYFFFLLISERQKKTVSISHNPKSLEKMKTVLKYVEEHYTEKLTIDDMAKLTFYSKSHFMKFFKVHMGTGFTEYLNDYRLTMAARLLKSSDESILMIAEESGFDNLSYFNRYFQKKIWCFPRKLQKIVSICTLLTAKQTTINRRIPERALASFKVRAIYEQSMLARVRQIKFNKFVVIFFNLPLDKSHYI